MDPSLPFPHRTRHLLVLTTLAGVLAGLWAATWTVGTSEVRPRSYVGAKGYTLVSPFPGVVWISGSGEYEIHLWAPGWSRRVYESCPWDFG